MGQVPLTGYVVYCHTRTVLDRREYPREWEPEMRRAYADLRTALGPWREADVVDQFTLDYGRDDSQWPFTRQAIAAFFRSREQLLERRGGDPPAALPPR